MAVLLYGPKNKDDRFLNGKKGCANLSLGLIYYSKASSQLWSCGIAPLIMALLNHEIVITLRWNTVLWFVDETSRSPTLWSYTTVLVECPMLGSPTVNFVDYSVNRGLKVTYLKLQYCKKKITVRNFSSRVGRSECLKTLHFFKHCIFLE
jgi:hypothetical protein